VVTGVTFIEVGSVMVLTTSQTTATRMFAMFAHSSMAVGDVASKFSCVAQSGRHCTAGGVDVVVTPEVAGEIEGKIVAVTHTSCQLARARGQGNPPALGPKFEPGCYDRWNVTTPIFCTSPKLFQSFDIRLTNILWWELCSEK
jgi:hypothetical protein